MADIEPSWPTQNGVGLLMKEWTGIQIQSAARDLEQAAAEILGQMMFEFSRLDVAVGLFLVWTDEGRQLESLTTIVNDYALNRKLELLKDLVDGKYSTNPEAQALYNKWLTDAHATRIKRNEFVHGLWGLKPLDAQVVNIVGLPTSPDQREIRYTIPELKSTLAELKDLQTRLQVLRKEWPV
jgi:hypothetical protein